MPSLLRRQALVWQQVHWQRPVEASAALELLRQSAGDPLERRLTLEVRRDDHGLRYLLATTAGAAPAARHSFQHAVAGTRLLPPDVDRAPLQAVGRLHVTRRDRALRTDNPEAATRASLGALQRVRRGECLALQVMLGPRRAARSVSAAATAEPQTIWQYLAGTGLRRDSEGRSALRSKQSEPAFGAVVRLGVTAASRERRRSLIAGLFAALRVVEAPGVRLRLLREPVARLDEARAPWRWGTTLNIAELLPLLAWPLGEQDLPGLPNLHPVLLPPPAELTRAPQRVIGTGLAPGHQVPVGLSVEQSLRHVWAIGPTGSGKSTLLLNLLSQDIAAGRGVVLIEPKGDLVEEVLARIPASRQGDVIVLDPSDSEPVGFNPLAGPLAPELRVDGVLSVLRALFAEAWGPRTQDILHACLLTLAQRPDVSLVMVPLLLTNTAFRRPLTTDAVRRDPIALGPFWGWYEALSDAERGAAIAPVMNKLRAFLLNPRLRAVLGQPQPRLDLTEVLRAGRILLVPLRRSSLGAGSAGLLGSLVVADLWQAIQARSNHLVRGRRPVMVYIDEVQDYLHLPTDLGDALAQARSLDVGFHLAHQYLAQLPPALRAGLLGNVRSRVCFQLAHDDAAVLARGHRELTADDLTALGRYEVYASLSAAGASTPYAALRTLPPPAAISVPDVLRRRSRATYGRPATDVERELLRLIHPATTPTDTASGRRRRQP